MSLTKTQLIEILDLIYNESQSPDIYSGLNAKGSLSLYWNDVSRNATIFKHTDGTRVEILAVFSPEALVYSGGFYETKLIKDIMFDGTDIEARDRGVSAYVDIKTFIRNIGVFLGVNFSSDIDVKQPVIFDEMVNICRKYWDESLENKAPYFLARYNTDYKTYVPLLCLVNIAIYLNNLGIFSVANRLLTPGLYFNNNNSNKYSGYGVKDIFNLQSKDDFYNNLINYAFPENSSVLTAFWNQYANSDLDFNQVIFIFTYTTTYSGSTSGTENHVKCLMFPSSCMFTNFVFNGVGNNRTMDSTVNFGVGYSYVNRYAYIYGENSFNITSFDFKQDIKSDGTITYSYNKNVQTIASGNNFQTSISSSAFAGYSNILTDTYIKMYCASKFLNGGSDTSSYRYYHIIDQFDLISSGYTVNTKDLHFLSSKYFMLLGNIYIQNMVLALKLQLNVTFTSNDFVFIISKGSNNFDLVIIRDIDTNITPTGRLGTIAEASTGYRGSGCCITLCDYYTTYNSSTPVYLSRIRAVDSSISSCGLTKLDFSDQVYCEYYTCYGSEVYENVTVSYNTTITTSSITADFYSLNLGAVIKVNNNNKEGISLIDNSIYPRNVTDLTSFINTYSNSTYRGISNPWFKEDELQNSIRSDTWVSCTVLDTPPATQDEAQNPNIENISDEDVENLDNDIINSVDDDDTKPNKDKNKPNKDDKVTDDDDTSTTLPESLDDLAEPLALGMLKTYVLTRQQMAQVGVQLNSPNLWNNIASGRFLDNPLDAIISLQTAYVVDTTGSTTENVEINGWVLDAPTVSARKLALSKCEFNLGRIAVSKQYENYLDITNTNMIIYLPFVGYKQLDIALFLGGYIRLVVRINNFTGDIVYFIYSDRSDASKCVYTFSGICQGQIPLKNDNFARFYQGALSLIGMR